LKPIEIAGKLDDSRLKAKGPYLLADSVGSWRNRENSIVSQRRGGEVKLVIDDILKSL
jgi:hypothetical protein